MRHIPIGCLLLSTLVIVTAAAAKDDAPAAAPPPFRATIRDSPGYIPLADPDSASLRLGRRMDAPVVKQPFVGGARSLDDLGHAVCKVLERPNLDSLMALTVTESEFRDIMWREFPQSRPATGLSSLDGWKVLYPRLLNGCNGALMDHAGGFFDFLRFENDSVRVYKNFKLHSGLIMVVRNAAGVEERLGWLRSVAERKGRFKIYSMRD